MRRDRELRRLAGWLAAYDLAWLPAIAVRAAIEAAEAPREALSTWTQRLGLPAIRRGDGEQRVVWLHAVSTGELLSIAPVLAALRASRPAWRLVVSVGNLPARRLAGRAFVPDLADLAVLAPWDCGACTRAAFRRLRPSLLAIVECELWPNLLAHAARIGCPAIALGARVYPADAARYRVARRWFGPLLRSLAAIGARSDADRERLIAIGARPSQIAVVGSTKPDAALAGPRIGRRDWPTLVRSARLWVLAATHPGEEEAIAVAWRRAGACDAQLVVAPRDPRRAPAVAAMLRSHGIEAATLGAIESGEAPRGAVVIDRLGELAAAVAAADLVFVGGTLRGRGAQTPLEAAAAGRAIVAGPSVRHFEDEAADLDAARGWVRAADADAIVAAVIGLLANPVARAELGRRARAVVERRAGAAGVYATWIERLAAGDTIASR